MPEEPNIAARKRDHIDIVESENVEHRESAGWEDIRLVHRATPEIDLGEIQLGIDLLGHRIQAPLIIAGMTGGHPRSHEVNARLSSAAEKLGLAMGVGSQRAAIADPQLASTYAVARELAPTAFLIANIGAAQLINQGDRKALSLEQIDRAVEMIRADALAIHLNFLEELVQPEGDRRSRGCLAAIETVTAHLHIPVIAKETGAGLSRSVARALADVGVAALDVGGVGGTSFAAVEALRAAQQGDVRGQRLGELFRDWGLPTAVSIVEARAIGLPIVATGGIRNGLDAAKALALGSTAVGVGRPLLQAALRGEQELDTWIAQFLAELQTALFLTGCARPDELPSTRPVVLGRTQAWLAELSESN